MASSSNRATATWMSRERNPSTESPGAVGGGGSRAVAAAGAAKRVGGSEERCSVDGAHGSVSERRFAAWDAGTMSEKGASPAAHRQIQTRVCKASSRQP